MDLLGRVIGERYQVDRLIGTGRFASVYAATDSEGDEPVALKVFLPLIAEMAGGGRRILLASKSSKKIAHPAVVPITECGQVDGVPFMVMELLEGRTLEQVIRDGGPLTMPRFLSIGTLMLEALAAAHSVGIVHRNLNPANVFLVEPDDSKPPVRILDFGVARDLVDHLAVSPKLIGSTRYLPPELLMQPDKAWTPTIDVFAAGMVLFLMLTGRLPFDPDDKDEDVYQKTILLYESIEKLPGPAELAPHVPEPLDQIVRRALELDPEQRYDDARKLLEALEEVEPDFDQPTSRPAVTSKGPWRPPRSDESARREPTPEPPPADTILDTSRPDELAADTIVLPESRDEHQPDDDVAATVVMDESDTVLDTSQPEDLVADTIVLPDRDDEAAQSSEDKQPDLAPTEKWSVSEAKAALEAMSKDRESEERGEESDLTAPENADPSAPLEDDEGAAMTLQWNPSMVLQKKKEDQPDRDEEASEGGERGWSLSMKLVAVVACVLVLYVALMIMLAVFGD